MDTATKLFLQMKFKEYYESAHLIPPASTSQREFGFIFFDENYPEIVMRRHKAFSDSTSLIGFIKDTIPAHVYYSAAYYDNPGAGKMEDKGWRAADLIFDLDADHLPRRDKRFSYEASLKRIKKETIKLIKWLINDFGVEKLSIVFSGGRGYHVHVHDSTLLELDSPERREVVDYLTGNLDLERIIEDIELRGDIPMKSRWRDILIECLHRWAKGVDKMRREDLRQTKDYLKSLELNRRQVEEFLNKLTDESLENLRKGDMNLFRFGKKRKLKDDLIRHLLERCITVKSVCIDEPVTTDTKRLIRMPTTLHGGTGLKVTPLTPDSIRDFEPFEDAVAFSNKKVDITIYKPVNIMMGGEEYNLAAGKERVPEFLAVFLLGRGMGRYGY